MVRSYATCGSLGHDACIGRFTTAIKVFGAFCFLFSKVSSRCRSCAFASDSFPLLHRGGDWLLV